ncbi:MAG: response regulator [Anaerolineae bacterium]|nr:response regulator [Anaerolineae bacterium]
MPRILIVEDEPNVRGNLMEILQLMNVDVRGAADGDEGLSVAREFLPDLLLCDVRMPHADGFKLLKELRNDPKIQHIPVILLTAHTDFDVREKGLQYGANEFLTKPIAVDDLINSVNRYLSDVVL